MGMKVILFGATGMVGQGVLRECLLDPAVELVLAIGRTDTAQRHPKLVEILHADFFDFTDIQDQISGFDACFFCLGISSAGMSETEYQRVTYGYTLAAAETLAPRNPGMTFIYVSGTGTDSSERGRVMWARIKGKTENALLKLPFKAHYMMRQGFIQPMHGIQSKTRLYRTLYAVSSPLFPVLNALLPNYVTTTERVGRAMFRLAKDGSPKIILENRDINALSS